jgi:hypothetical protein
MLSDMVRNNPEPIIKLSRGKRIVNFPGTGFRTTELELVVRESDDLEAIAKTLAMGKSHDAILVKLRKSVRDHQTHIPLLEVSPDFAKNYTDTYAICDGANCANAVLNWYDPNVGVKHTGLEEFKDALSRQFIPLKSFRDLRYGDLIVISGDNGVPRHTMVYISGDKVWNKAEKIKEFPWSFSQLKDVVDPQFVTNKTVKFSFYRRKK